MHAYLVTGKTLLARRQKAEEIFSQNRVGEKILLARPQNRHQIEEIRQLRRRLSLKVPAGATRGVLIEEAQLLTTEAGNALLKTLEEPPGNTLIVLLAPNVQVVLPTIASRCLNLDLGPGIQEISKDEKETGRALFEKLIRGGVGEKLELVEEIHGRQEGLIFLTGQIQAGREVLLARPSRALAELLENLEKTRQDLESNVNPRLAIADLLLKYPQAA